MWHILVFIALATLIYILRRYEYLKEKYHTMEAELMSYKELREKYIELELELIEANKRAQKAENALAALKEYLDE